MSFRNPILAGPTLVRAAIQSANFLTGVSGWQIQRNGIAEFNGATFRGDVLIASDEGVFFYSGVPGPSDLVASLAPTSGNDPFGTSYPAGLKIGASGSAGVLVGYSGTSGIIFFPGVVANVKGDASLFLNHIGAGNAAQSFLTIGSPVDNVQLDSVAMSLWMSSHDGTGKAHTTLTYTDPTGATHTYMVIDATGASLTGLVTGVHPGTGTGSGNPAVAETWQNPSFGAGWTTGTFGGGVRSLHYRLDADGYGFLVGTFHSNNAAPAATICTLPSGYFDPTDSQPIPVLVNNAGALAINGLSISAAGAVSLINNLTTTNTDVWVDARYRVS